MLALRRRRALAVLMCMMHSSFRLVNGSFVVSSSSRQRILLKRFAASTTTTTTSPKLVSAKDRPSQWDVPCVVLKRSHQSKAFRNGNQLVFTRAIREKDGVPNTVQQADFVQVAVEEKEGLSVVGWGVYNPESLYKVRIVCHKHLQTDLHQRLLASCNATEALRLSISHHVKQAVRVRQSMGLLGGEETETTTDTYRLIHGEGDGLSGLAVDIIANVGVVMSSAAWCQIHQATLQAVLEEVMPEKEWIWKTTPARLRQDGYQASMADDSNQEDESSSHRPVMSRENGLMFETYPFSDGQKTGVYCDQRENKLHIAKLCQHKRVLDLCCYHGGFGLTAVVQGGAASAVGVDSSADAIDICNKNAALNECSERMEFHQSDVTDFLRDAVAHKSEYDVVVLDPPKLAPSVSALEKARRKYHALNRDACKVIDSQKGGLLLTCTCSAAMTQKDGGQYFLHMVQGAAQAAGREVTLLSVSGAAKCHTQSPMAYPAGAYLTAALFHVHSQV